MRSISFALDFNTVDLKSAPLDADEDLSVVECLAMPVDAEACLADLEVGGSDSGLEQAAARQEGCARPSESVQAVTAAWTD